MLTEIAKLRANTLANNLIWLESFGCEVHLYGDSIYIAHPKLQQYCAWLIMGSPAEALERLKAVVAGLNPTTAAPYIYVDETSSSPELRAELRAKHFKAAFVNSINAGVWTPLTASTDVLLRSASPNEVALWASLYSEGFGRSGSDAKNDLARWKQSLEGGKVRHWFLVEGEKTIGVCQTCMAWGVVGIYSFTIKPSARSVYKLRKSLRALRAKLTKRGETIIYFERLRKKELGKKQRVTQTARGLTVIRKMTGYQRAG